MKALVYHGPGQKAWEEKEKPSVVAPTDAVIRVQKATICGTDLHIMKGDVPTVVDGRTLGHEGMGVVEEVGSAVKNFKPGDRVLISCITSCGKCEYCKKAMYSHCEDGGWSYTASTALPLRRDGAAVPAFFLRGAATASAGSLALGRPRGAAAFRRTAFSPQISSRW